MLKTDLEVMILVALVAGSIPATRSIILERVVTRMVTKR